MNNAPSFNDLISHLIAVVDPHNYSAAICVQRETLIAKKKDSIP
jgi:hypothetical protein